MEARRRCGPGMNTKRTGALPLICAVHDEPCRFLCATLLDDLSDVWRIVRSVGDDKETPWTRAEIGTHHMLAGPEGTPMRSTTPVKCHQRQTMFGIRTRRGSHDGSDQFGNGAEVG
jgi:hypothetical protein